MKLDTSCARAIKEYNDLSGKQGKYLITRPSLILGQYFRAHRVVNPAFVSIFSRG